MVLETKIVTNPKERCKRGLVFLSLWFALAGPTVGFARNTGMLNSKGQAVDRSFKSYATAVSHNSGEGIGPTVYAAWTYPGAYIGALLRGSPIRY